jgi:glycosyltransferase involved in cell wall biosynthesis
MKINFIIVVSGYNCAPYVFPCLKSIVNQHYDNGKIKIIVIDDASTDNTLSEINQFYETFIHNNPRFKHLFQTMSYKQNHGAAFCRHAAISTYGQDNDVVIFVGLDDELLPCALNRICREYQNGKWMTYGNWINQYGKMLPVDFELDFPDEIHETRAYRTVPYRSTAPNTFRIELFRQIPICDFLINGNWIDTTTESEVMFSCLEMCGKKRIGIIREPIYLYNQNLPNGTQRRLGQEYKNKVLGEITKRKSKPLITEL